MKKMRSGEHERARGHLLLPSFSPSDPSLFFLLFLRSALPSSLPFSLLSFPSISLCCLSIALVMGQKRGAKRRQQEAEERRGVRAKAPKEPKESAAEANPFNVRQQRRKHAVLGQKVRCRSCTAGTERNRSRNRDGNRKRKTRTGKDV